MKRTHKLQKERYNVPASIALMIGGITMAAAQTKPSRGPMP